MQSRHRRATCWLAWLFILALLTGPALAKQAVVVTKEGRRFEGELVEQTGERIVLQISGIKTTIDRENVESFEVQPGIEQIYEQRRAELEDDDLDGRYALAYDMYDRGAYDLALQEINALLERFPNADRVQRLKDVVEQSRRMDEQSDAQDTDDAGDGVSPDGPPAAAGRPDRPDPLPRLSQTQINRIRVYEVDLDEEPRIFIPNSTIQAFLNKYGSDERVPTSRSGQADFKRAEGYRQLDLFFQLQAREFYGDVVVRQDPPVMRAFSRRMHRQYVLNYCGTNQCHGGEEAPGNLRLMRQRAASTETAYTNFYILHSAESGQGLLIDRAKPEQSLVLQYGMPRNMVDSPHPAVPGWSPRFRNRDDSEYQRFTRIIDALWTPTPDYGINFTPPGREASREGGGEAGASGGPGAGGAGEAAAGGN